MVLLGSSLTAEGFFLFVDLWEVQPCLRDPKWDSRITLWGMIKVYWLDLTLAYIFDHAVCCKFGLKLTSQYKLDENEVKFIELSEPCLVN